MSIVLADKVFPEIAAWGDELTAIRREIHSYPELGFDTAVTVSRIVTLLKNGASKRLIPTLSRAASLLKSTATVRVRPWLCVPTLMRSR